MLSGHVELIESHGMTSDHWPFIIREIIIIINMSGNALDSVRGTTESA